MVDKPLFELQVFDPRARRYETRAGLLTLRQGESVFAAYRARSKRLVRTDKARDPVPRYRPPRRPATVCVRYDRLHNSPRDRDAAVIRTYLEWAQARGLESVAIYEGADYARRFATEKHRLAVRAVPVADFLGAAPAPEPEPEPWE